MGYDTNNSKSISPLQTSRSTHHLSPPRENRDMPSFMGLLKAVMSVCAADGKIIRLQQLTRDANMSEESFMIALQRICDILGCYRLAINMPQDVIMQAVSIYLDGYGNMGEIPNNLLNLGQINGNMGQNIPLNMQQNMNNQNLSLSQREREREREYRLQVLRTENEMYGKGNNLLNSLHGPQSLQNGGQWGMPNGSQNGPNGPLNRSIGQWTSFNYDSSDNGGNIPPSQSLRGSFQGQGPGQNINNNNMNHRQYLQDQNYNNQNQNQNQNQNRGGNYGMSGSRISGGPYLSSHDMDDEMMMNEHNMNGINLINSDRSGDRGNGRGGPGPNLSPGGTNFGVNNHNNGNLSSRISRASFSASVTSPTPLNTNSANANYSLQQDMARLQQQQVDFPTQPISVGRGIGGGSGSSVSGSNIGLPRGMASPRLTSVSGNDGLNSERSSERGSDRGGNGLDRSSERSREDIISRDPSREISPVASGLNSQSIPFYPTSATLSPSALSANMNVIKNNLAASASAGTKSFFVHINIISF